MTPLTREKLWRRIRDFAVGVHTPGSPYQLPAPTAENKNLIAAAEADIARREARGLSDANSLDALNSDKVALSTAKNLLVRSESRR